MARIRFAAMDPEQIAKIFGGAKENAMRNGEVDVGPTYSGGVPQKPEFAGQRLIRRGLLEGEFGAPLNNAKDPAHKPMTEQAKRFVDQAMPSPWFTEYFGGGAPPPESGPAKESSKEVA